ncbi:hypothetical protein ENSA7_76650 [Enhygromyxa salina]|uniref:Uncharacterized protein n=1 Tax=Enhygromyxa salina TaxID=215803 RepID=A0A2S9XPQ6_9BACT|nr:hypothetical protein ENSA7_76650 [Enhygromyxa salina]
MKMLLNYKNFGNTESHQAHIQYFDFDFNFQLD